MECVLYYNLLYFLSTFPQAIRFRHMSVFHYKHVDWPVILVGCYYQDMTAHVELTLLGRIYIKVNAFVLVDI